MTVQDNYAPTKTLGNGSTTEFSFNWRMFNSSYSRVYLEDVTTGAQVLQTLGSDYTLDFDTSGGTVTFGTAPTSDDYVIVSREIGLTQDTNYTTSQGFQGDVVENDFDKSTAIDQDLEEKQARGWRYPLGTDVSESTGVSADMPVPTSATAGNVLAVNSAGDGWEVNSTSDSLPNTADTYIRRNTANTLWVTKTPTEVATELFALKTTTNLTEGTNLYYTTARFDTAFATKDTDDLTEGSTNLYDQTVVLTAGAGITIGGSYPNFTITNTVTASELPQWYVNCLISYVSSNTVSVSAGSCRNEGDTADITIAANASVSATLSAFLTYYVNIDAAGVATLSTTKATGTGRAIYAFKTDGSSNILPFTSRQIAGGGIETLLNTPVTVYSAVSSIPTTATNIFTPAPAMATEAYILGSLEEVSGGTRTMTLYDGTGSSKQAFCQVESSSNRANINARIATDSSGGIKHACSNADADDYKIECTGYRDERRY